MKNYLDFEKEIKALEEEVENLKSPFGSEGISEVDTKKIRTTQEEINEKLKQNPNDFKSTFQRASIRNYLGDNVLALNDFKKIEKNILKNKR